MGIAANYTSSINVFIFIRQTCRILKTSQKLSYDNVRLPCLSAKKRRGGGIEPKGPDLSVRILLRLEPKGGEGDEAGF